MKDEFHTEKKKKDNKCKISLKMPASKIANFGKEKKEIA